jgi:hypothetical protein
MTALRIASAMEKRLKSLSPALPTKWEGAQYTATAGTAWQRATVMFSDTRALGVFGEAPEEWTGYLHISLNYPNGQGAQPARTRATLLCGDRDNGVQGHFYRGQVLIEGNTKVTIYQPIIKTGDDSDPLWYSLPVHIPFLAHTI